MFRFVDLFAGIGGFRIACEKNGGQCVFSSEWDKQARKTYLANFGHLPSGDIADIDVNDIPNHELITAGFPCQPFSRIGKKEGFNHVTQGNAFFEIVRILEHHQTKMILLENVQTILSHDEGNTFQTILSKLVDQLGYQVFYKTLDSSDFGLPQKRKRVYIVGFLQEVYGEHIEFTWPEINRTKHFINEFIETHPTGYNITPHLQQNYLFKKNDGLPQVVDKTTKVFVRTLSASYYKIQRQTGTFIRDGDTGIRRFSKNECLSIMGFPMDFIVPVSRAQMYKQFGNSVTIPVVQKIVAQMLKVKPIYKNRIIYI